MTIQALKGKVDDLIPVQNALVSVYDKSGLDELIPELLKINPQIRFISTGGTYKKIAEMLGDNVKDHLIEVSAYTGFPEILDGRVKTLHPRIHGGLLAFRGNAKHMKELNEYCIDLIDMVVVNLYPFEQTIQKEDVRLEDAIENIDIGGPAMLRAAAKNFPSCAAVCDPRDYDNILKVVKNNNGCTTLTQRISLMIKVFDLTSKYDTSISQYMWVKINSGDDVMKMAKEYIEGGR